MITFSAVFEFPVFRNYTTSNERVDHLCENRSQFFSTLFNKPSRDRIKLATRTSRRHNDAQYFLVGHKAETFKLC